MEGRRRAENGGVKQWRERCVFGTEVQGRRAGETAHGYKARAEFTCLEDGGDQAWTGRRSTAVVPKLGRESRRIVPPPEKAPTEQQEAFLQLLVKAIETAGG